MTPWMSKFNFNMFHQTVDREFVNVIRPGGPVVIMADNFHEQTTFGFNLDATLEFAQGRCTLVGIQYENDFIDSDKTTTASMPGPPVAPTLRNNDARIKTFSIYGQHEMDFTNTLTGTVGMRFYKVDAELEASNASVLTKNSNSRWFGSAGLVWALGEELVQRMNLSQGYSFPTLQQLFMTTSAAGRVTSGTPRFLAKLACVMNGISATSSARWMHLFRAKAKPSPAMQQG